MSWEKEFSFHFYFKTLTQLLGAPRNFFSELPQEVSWKQSLGFLGVSSLVFAMAGVMHYMSPKPFVLGSILFVNAVGMTLILASFGYMVMVMTVGRQASFPRFVSIYSFSAGVTLLASWLPFFLMITEPWKWWLIWTGMSKGLGFNWRQTLMIIGISVTMMVLLFWSALPLILPT